MDFNFEQVATDTVDNVMERERQAANYARMHDVVKDAPCDNCKFKCKSCYNGLQCTAFDLWIEMSRYCVSWQASWRLFEDYRHIEHRVDPAKGILVTYGRFTDEPHIVKIGDIYRRHTNDHN